MHSRLTAVITALAALAAITTAYPAAADPSAGTREPALTTSQRSGEPALTIEPNYDGNTKLSFATLEWEDALANYSPTVIEVATGRSIPLGFGYAETDDYSDLEGPYEVPTAEPLVAGSVYDVTLRLSTVGYWHCSIYDEDGCSWYEGETYTYRYRFTWSGSRMTGSAYVPPKATSRITLSRKAKWSAHGWKITATLLRDGSRADRMKLTGQWRTTGGWRTDNTWRTNSQGKLTITFKGETKPTRYRVVFTGNDTTKASASKIFEITRRR